MRLRLWMITVMIPLGISAQAFAFSKVICNLDEGLCGNDRKKTISASPSNSSRINVNPSAVPTEKGYGVEIIGYKGSADIGLVRGLGRMGAAISPSNSEDTFFGAPSAEYDFDYLERKNERDKYRNQKYTLATAFNLFDIKKSAIRRFSLNVGVLGKYNTITQATTPGAGFSGIVGPFTFGYSFYRDETLLEKTTFDPLYPQVTTFPEQKVQSIVETYTAGVYLSNLVFDFSSLRMQNTTVTTVELLTFALLLDRWIFSTSQRRELSTRKSYNYKTRQLDVEEEKIEYFYGAQYKVGAHFMIGTMYNYYMMREFSGSVTILF